MKLKQGVECKTLSMKCFEGMFATAKLLKAYGYDMVVTSITDGIHLPHSKHYTGDAFDIRSRDMSNPVKMVSIIKDCLGHDYDVIFERDHIHIEYDPK